MKLQSKTDIAAALYVILSAIEEATRTSALKGIPNGHLYAQLMGEFDLDQWTRLIDLLKHATNGAMITETNHLLSITPAGSQFLQTLNEAFKV